MKGDDPWFVAKDGCDVLDLVIGNSVRYLDDDEKTNLPRKQVSMTAGRDVILISESGLYSLILRSRKPEAKAFQDWVTRIILPTLRKDCMYVMGEEKVITGELEEAELILKVVTLLNGKVERLSSENAKIDVLTSILRHEIAEDDP